MENLPDSSVVIADSGFQGIHKSARFPSQVQIPYKGKKLHPSQKSYNQVLASRRVLNEHAIGAIKRNKSISQTLRHGAFLEDKFLMIACGLHNLSL